MKTISLYRARLAAFAVALLGLCGALRADITLTASPTGGVAAVQPGQSFSIDLTWTGDTTIAAGDAKIVLNTTQLLYTGAVFDPSLDFTATNPTPTDPASTISEVFCTWYEPAGFLGKTVTLTFQVPANYSGPGTVTVSLDLTGAHDVSGFELTGNSVNTSINIGTDTATLTGHLYVDTNGNGVQDAGEPDLPNVTVNFTDANSAAKSAVTDASGYWTVAVPPGSTSVAIDKADADFTSKVLTGYTQTEGSDPNSVTAVANVTTSGGNDGFFNQLYLTGQPGDLTLNPGASATFSVTAVGTGTVGYQWRKGGVNISGATSASYTIASVAEANEGIYDCVVTNVGGATTTLTSNAATLSVNNPVTISTQPASQTVTTGGTATFSVTAAGTGTLTYQWRKDGSNISGATSSTYTIAAVVVGDAGNYDVVITNIVGSVTSSAATLTVNTAPTAASFTWNGLDSDGSGGVSDWNVAGSWNVGGSAASRYPSVAGDVITASTKSASIYKLNGDITIGQFTSDRNSNRSLALAPGTASTETLTWDTGTASDALFYIRHGGANTKQLRAAITVHNMRLNSNLLMDVSTDRDYGASTDRNNAGGNNRLFSDISGSGKLMLRVSTGSSATTAAYWSIDGSGVGNTHTGGTEFQKTTVSTAGSLSQYRLNTVTATGSGDTTVKTGATVLVASVANSQGAIKNNTALFLETDGSSYGRLAVASGVTEQVALLSLNGTYQAKGTWGPTGSGATNINDNYFTTSLTNGGSGYTGKLDVLYSEPADLTTTANGTALSSGSVLPVTNSAGANGDAGKVTALSLSANAGTFSLSGISLNDTIAAGGGSLSGTVGYSASGALNGVVPSGSLTVTYGGVGVANLTKVNGSATSSARTLTYSLSASAVSGNTGSGSAQVAASGSFAGLYAVDAASSGTKTGFATRADFRNGTNTSGATQSLSVQFPSSASSTGSLLSDVVRISGIGGSKYVLQVSYDTSSSPSSPMVGYWNGSAWTNAVAGNSSGTPSNVGNVAWSGSYTTLGQYGYDQASGVAWAVVDFAGDFAVYSANTAPTISSISNQNLNLNTATGALAFTVGDAETAAGSLTVSATSSNQTRVPDANLVLGGSGASRTLTVTPATDQQGATTVTVTVSDGSLSASTSFTVTVNASARQSWWITHFGTSNTGSGNGAFSADPDGDGLDNLLEYSQGANPNASDRASRNPSAVKSGNQMVFTYRKDAADVTYTVQQSSTLDPESWTAVTAEETDNGNGTFSRSVPISGSALYLRLKVTAQ